MYICCSTEKEHKLNACLASSAMYLLKLELLALERWIFKNLDTSSKCSNSFNLVSRICRHLYRIEYMYPVMHLYAF